jgi:CubicO group peptidase (beta-lactamase class C family)
MNDQLAEFMDDLHEPIQKEMRKRSVPGLSLGILYNGSLASTAFGVTNIEHPLEVNDQTLFQIGSISKTFVSTAVMRLVEMGELSLNAPIRKYLPGFKVTDDVATSKASIWHLLTHTAGWEGDFFIDTGSGIDALSRFAAEMASLKQLVPFGSTWSYNNAGFNLLGRIIEVVANLRFQDAMKTLVFEPLGLTNCFFEARDVITNRFAVGHMESARDGEHHRDEKTPGFHLAK